MLLVAPVYSGGHTLFQVNGPRIFGVLAIPVAIALAPLALRWLRIPAAIALFAFVLIGGFTIGFFYLPSAILLAWPERR